MFNEDILANTQLNGNGMDFVISNLKSGLNFSVQQNVGITTIPNGKEISFVSPSEETNQIWALDPIGGQAKGITNIQGSRFLLVR